MNLNATSLALVEEEEEEKCVQNAIEKTENLEENKETKENDQIEENQEKIAANLKEKKGINKILLS